MAKRKKIYYYTAKEQLFRAKFSYEFFVDQEGNHYYYNNKRLISPSAMNAIAYSLDFGKVPTHVIDSRREIGSNLMRNLKYMFDNKIDDIDNLMVSDLSKKHLYTIARFLKEHKLKILDVEKFVCNNHFCGIVDLLAIYKTSEKSPRVKVVEIIEIKVRNSLESKIQDFYK